MELREGNEVLKSQIATLTESQTTVTVEGTSTNLSSPASKSPQNSTPTPHSASPVSGPSSTPTPYSASPVTDPSSTPTPHSASPGAITDPSSTKALTSEEINQFNKIPKDLKEFFEQISTGKFSREVYIVNAVALKVYLPNVNLCLSIYKSTLLE